jgi:hypothetical protein
MYDDRTNLAQQVTDTLREYFRDRLFQTVIPRNVRLAEAPSHGKPVALYDPRSRGPRPISSWPASFWPATGSKARAALPAQGSRLRRSKPRRAPPKGKVASGLTPESLASNLIRQPSGKYFHSNQFCFRPELNPGELVAGF